MPRTKISEFSATPASNTDIDSINISEGCAPSGINDAIRELMAQLKDFQTGAVGDSFNGPVGTTTAAAGAFTTLSSTGNTTLGDASGDSVTINGTATFANANPTLSAGTANGVAYLNGSKVVTSGSALVYGGSNLILTSGGTWATDAGGIQLSMNGNDGYLTTYFDTHTVTIGAGVSAKNQIKVSGAGGANNINFKVNSSDAMTLTSTGLGIGTSSPASKLHVNTGSAGYGITIAANTQTGRTYQLGVDSNSSFALYDSAAAAQRLVVDSSGNLGLGVTPSAWGSGYKAIQLLTSSLYGTTSRDMNLGANVYVDAVGYKYIQTSFATNYTQYQGAHAWYNAPSGTAGNAITFTQAMTLDASGGLQIGRTSVIGTNNRLAIQMSGTSASGYTAASNASLAIDAGTSTNTVINMVGGGDMGIYHSNSSNAYDVGIGLGSNADRIITFTTANAERARIDSSGNLLVGKTASSDSTLGAEMQAAGTLVSTRSGSTSAQSTLIVYSTGASAYRFYVGMNGTINATNTTITAISDQRLKENIRDLDDGLSAVMALKPRKFDWKEGKGADIKNARGFIAQEFETVFPDMIEEWRDPAPEGEEAYKAINANLIPTLVKALQEQQAIINSLKARLDAANL